MSFFVFVSFFFFFIICTISEALSITSYSSSSLLQLSPNHSYHKSILSRKMLRKIRNNSALSSSTALSSTVTDLVTVPSEVSTFVPPDVGIELYIASLAPVLTFTYAAVLFSSRIEEQRSCGVCKGIGLVYETASGEKLSKPRKCKNCGGFLPWLGWKKFWLL